MPNSHPDVGAGAGLLKSHVAWVGCGKAGALPNENELRLAAGEGPNTKVGCAQPFRPTP